ncbi:uncharacterized protein M421DRAFT_58439, partial [Didymella exigua CBS 183.55]
ADYAVPILQEDRWAPRPTLSGLELDPERPPENADEPALVMTVQTSFMRGGLVLCVNMQHNIWDVMGQAVVVQWNFKVCSGSELTREELRLGNMKRNGPIIFSIRRTGVMAMSSTIS